MVGLVLVFVLIGAIGPADAQSPAVRKEKGDAMMEMVLWPDRAPGDNTDIGEEKDTSPANEDRHAPNYVSRIGNVSRPTITLFRAPKEHDTGATVVVCPGGGYYILAMNLEGTEVCKWLNSIGVSAVLLKYRVPVRAGRERYAAPLQDAQRALGLVRQHAAQWGIDKSRIGILGFSAGGHLSATASANWAERTYPKVDAADEESCRPDFTVLIYPAYLTPDKDLTMLAPEVNVTSKNPPTFIAMTQDDPVHVEGALVYSQALQRSKVPFEIHVYPKGGHGYGLRPSQNLVSQWPQRLQGWLETQGLLKARH